VPSISGKVKVLILWTDDVVEPAFGCSLPPQSEVGQEKMSPVTPVGDVVHWG